MTRLCVTGYASLDYVLELAAPVMPDQTAHAAKLSDGWPRAGGCPTYISMAAAKFGQKTTPVMWVGDDPLATQLLDRLTDQGISTDGVARVAGAVSPTAVLLYQPDGSCACIYDPGLAGQEALTPAQEMAILSASHVCISVGPPHLIAAIMALRAPEARLYWAVKNDPACFTPDVCAQLCQDTDVIFCSAAERKMIGRTNAVVVQTMGAKGVRIEDGHTITTLPVSALEVHDATGAGDSFAGGYIAAEMSGVVTPNEAAQVGIDTANRLLTTRQRGRTT